MKVDAEGPEGVPHVLVVDDEPRIRDVFCDLLRAVGCAVQTAPGGAEAIDLARSVARLVVPRTVADRSTGRLDSEELKTLLVPVRDLLPTCGR